MPNPLPLSVAIITLNEEKNLPRCLESVRDLAREIIIVDSGSTDATADIARQFGATLVAQSWLGFTAQKNSALEGCSQPWILALDADEVVSPELAKSLRQILSTDSRRETGFRINRRTQYLGEWIWHSWYPEWRLQLVRKSHGVWRGRDPHPQLEATGEIGELEGDLLHYSYSSLQEHLQRTTQYAKTSAIALAHDGKTARWYQLFFSPLLTFLKKIFLRQGWRDGWRGWLIAFVTAFGVFAKYAFLLETRLAEKRAR